MLVVCHGCVLVVIRRSSLIGTYSQLGQVQLLSQVLAVKTIFDPTEWKTAIIRIEAHFLFEECQLSLLGASHL